MLLNPCECLLFGQQSSAAAKYFVKGIIVCPAATASNPSAILGGAGLGIRRLGWFLSLSKDGFCEGLEFRRFFAYFLAAKEIGPVEDRGATGTDLSPGKTGGKATDAWKKSVKVTALQPPQGEQPTPNPGQKHLRKLK